MITICDNNLLTSLSCFFDLELHINPDANIDKYAVREYYA
jgi:hypothetical protein